MASSDASVLLAQAAGGASAGNSGALLQQLLSDLVSAAGGTQGSAGQTEAELAQQLSLLKSASEKQTDTVAENTSAVEGNTTAQSSSSAGAVVKTAGNIFSSVFGSGLGLSPLVTGLAKLFGGGDSGSATPVPLPAYTAPEAVRLEGRITRSTNATDWSGSQGMETGVTPAVAAPQITVQVNAIDSRSFLDHSADIARAVREAMLNSHSLNDVVNDL